MKTKYIFSLLITSSLLVSSCKKEIDETTEESSNTPKEIIMPRVQSLPLGNEGTTAAQQNPGTIQNGAVQQQTIQHLTPLRKRQQIRQRLLQLQLELRLRY